MGLSYKIRKEKVDGTSKVTLTPTEKEASSQHVESSLKGLSNLSIPDDMLNYDFDDPEAFKLHSPIRGDAGTLTQSEGEKNSH